MLIQQNSQTFLLFLGLEITAFGLKLLLFFPEPFCLAVFFLGMSSPPILNLIANLVNYGTCRDLLV